MDKQERMHKKLIQIIETIFGENIPEFESLGEELLKLGAGLTEIEYHFQAIDDYVTYEYNSKANDDE